MIVVRTPSIADFYGFTPQPAQRAQYYGCTDLQWSDAFNALVRPRAFVGQNGRVLMLAALESGDVSGVEGVVVWAFLADAIGSEMVALTRAAKHYLAESKAAIIAMLVAPGHVAGDRWARMLGFTYHGASIAIDHLGQPLPVPHLIYLWEEE